MKEFPKDIRFKYSWRGYQKRILDELQVLLDDKRLHVIAPPGSGKTVLGLEVALRLNRPTLIFAPTITIKNQWVDRFCELFLQTESKPDWISTSIKDPKFLTVTTYQALHAICTNSLDEEADEILGEEEVEELNNKSSKKLDIKRTIKLFKDQNISTIIVDEAHHLKNEWWKSLTAVIEGMQPTVVSLTATPPYDVSYSEWQRYLELNGPVDAEISVPELVAESDLCPHQDFIYLCEPTEEEQKIIQDQRSKILKIFNEVKLDGTLKQALIEHPAFMSPLNNLEWIYSNIQYHSSIIIFLNSIGVQIPEIHLEVIGNKKFIIPILDYEWIEILLNYYLFVDQEYFVNYQEHKENLINRFTKNGLIEFRTVNFRNNQKINKSLHSSLSKLKSIGHIVDVEYSTLKEELRMVILTDYIRKEFLVNGNENNLDLVKIGVVPIFELLRRKYGSSIKIGVLSGSLVIIPNSTLGAFKKHAEEHQIYCVNCSSLPFDSEFSILEITDSLRQKVVDLITEIFESGEIQVLIGTKSLLGEGWDAPKINSLILASFVGSFVLSNQMRGRAIRIDRKNPNKTGNIWHLVCADKAIPNGGDDIQLIQRRFKGFIGTTVTGREIIENGVDRLMLPKEFSPRDNLEYYREFTVQNASQRNSLKQRWDSAIKNGVSLTDEMKIPFPKKEKTYKELTTLYYNKTIRHLFGLLSSGLIAFGKNILEMLIRNFHKIKSVDDIYKWILGAGLAGVLIFGIQFIYTLRLYIKYRDISKDIQRIGEALLQSLVKSGTVKTNTSELSVVSSVDENGAIYCHLEGGTTFEKSTFIKSLQEIVEPIDNPRYIINRKSSLTFIEQNDYHAVPEIIGQNKNYAEHFENMWKYCVGSCALIYTRNIEGRKLLLKARMNSLSSEFEVKNEQIRRWR